MSVNRIQDKRTEELKTTYSLDSIQFIEMNKIVSVFIKINGAILNSIWKQINSVLSEYLAEYLDSPFKKWNVYILFIATDTVSKELKYEIENNKFFARKIVVDNYHEQLTDENIEKLISKYITINDLNIEDEQSKAEEYVSTSKVYMLLKDKKNIDGAEVDNMLKLLENEENEI